MSYTDNPLRDYDNYCMEQERRLAKCPVCDVCKEPIVEDDFYDVDGDYVCEHCIKDYIDDKFRVSTEGYIQ